MGESGSATRRSGPASSSSSDGGDRGDSMPSVGLLSLALLWMRFVLIGLVIGTGVLIGAVCAASKIEFSLKI